MMVVSDGQPVIEGVLISGCCAGLMAASLGAVGKIRLNVTIIACPRMVWSSLLSRPVLCYSPYSISALFWRESGRAPSPLPWFPSFLPSPQNPLAASIPFSISCRSQPTYLMSSSIRITRLALAKHRRHGYCQAARHEACVQPADIIQSGLHDAEPEPMTNHAYGPHGIRLAPP
ncbi:hypothetical protein ASPBRDRAFT_491469 [Aspergillus brasiliensis CBS 101740]|uniref:Uncharacterized protein n=1 Tax=Aspergillus brasiliensis (strain CBS 101740 / IMI 381727 / IBT 21946) TaxID=767769 RepID=A0A1L9UN41_ASPBC|nr:hypothetical protein ASPBRDRAFT_491469 [Aspergillus brasiliensis CBS 101740]